MTDRTGPRPDEFSIEEIRGAEAEVRRLLQASERLLSPVAAPPEGAPPPEPRAAPLSASILPEPARAWAEACATWLDMDQTMPTIAAICAAASVLQGRVRVRWRAGVEEPVCLYWLVFSATGTLKSQVLSHATRAIRQLELEWREQAAKENEERAGQRKWREQQVTRLRRKPAPNALADKQRWLQEIAEYEHELAQFQPVTSPQWLQGDVNPSLLPKILRHNYEAEGIARCAVLIDEGTFLSNITGRHQGSTQVETLLSAVNGSPLDFVRASQTSDEMVSIRLPATYMTICALVQPDYYDRLTKNQQLADCGFLGRTIRTVLDAPARKVPLDSPPIPDAIQSAYDAWLRALATADVPEVVDLTEDAATGQCVREMYDSVELDGTGFSKRVIGLVARIGAIIKVGNEMGHPRSLSHPQSKRLVESTDAYDWIDDYAGSEGDRGLGTIGEGSEGGTDGTGCAPPLIRVLKEIFLYIYVQSLPRVRSVERPSDPLAQVVASVCRHLPWCSPIPKSNRRRVRDLAKTWNAKTRPGADRLYRALEELEEQGVIEWVPASARRYGGETRYREFILTGETLRDGQG